MNSIELLHTVLARVFPAAELTLTKPLDADGSWSLDVRSADYHLGIDWSELGGFSLTADPEHGYGEGADEVYRDFAAALPRVIELVRNRLDTVPCS